MGFALAEEAARRGADVTVVAANVDAAAQRRRSTYVDVETAEELRAATLERFADVRRAADGGRGRRLPAGRAAGRQDRQGGARRARRSSSCAPPTCSPRPRARRRPGQTLVGFAAEHGAEARRARAREARAQGARRDRRQRHLARGDRLRLRRERGHDRRPRTASATSRARRRPRSPRRCSTSSRTLRATQLARTTPEASDERRDRSFRPTRRRTTPTRSSSAACRCSPDSHWAQAAVSLEKAKRLEPDKTSIREALGRAYFRSGRYRPRRERVLRRGRALARRTTTRTSASAARSRSSATAAPRSRHLSLACGMRPDRTDYRLYRDRLRAA